MSENSEQEAGGGVMPYTVRLAGCDESKHPYCEGVVTPAAASRRGFTSKHQADIYGRNAIQEERQARDVVEDGGVLLNGAAGSTILRDYLIEDEAGVVIDEGDHDDYGVFN